jgi:hypothetical protein
VFGPDEDGGYEAYEASPYYGDDLDGADFDTFGPEEVSDEDDEDDDGDDEDEEEPTDEEVEAWEQAEDAHLDAEWEDRLSGLSGFEGE